MASARTASEPAQLVPLAPYEVDDSKCLVGMHIHGGNIHEYAEKLARYEPSLTKNAHNVCRMPESLQIWENKALTRALYSLHNAHSPFKLLISLGDSTFR